MKKISAFIAVVMVICCVFAFSVSAEGTAYSASADLGLDKTVNGDFYIGAYKIETGKVVAVDETAVPLWSDDWTGNWVAEVTKEGADGRYNVTQRTENDAADAKFDFYPAADGTKYGAAICFKAPENGVYSAEILIHKLGWAGKTFTLKTSTGTVIDTQVIDRGDNDGRGPRVTFTATDVELAKGEELWFICTNSEDMNGTPNTTFISFDVEGTLTPAAQQPSNPTTGDSVVVAFVVAAVAGTAIIVSKKRK